MLRPGLDRILNPSGDGRPAKALHWWLLCSAGLGASFVLGAILYVWLYMQQVEDGYRLARCYAEHEKLLAVQRKLRLEWCRLQDPFQLEEMGSKQFGLAQPKPEQKLLMR